MTRDWKTGAWRWLKEAGRPYRRSVLLLCIGTAAAGLGAVALALVVRQVVNRGIAGEGLALWGAAFLLLTGGLLLVQLWLRWYTGRTRDGMARELRRRLLACLLSRRYESLADLHSADLVSRLGEDVNAVCGELVSLLPGLLGNIVRVLGALAALAYLSTPLALILLAAGVILCGGAAFLRAPLKRRSRRVREAESMVRLGLQESLENREAAKSLRMERELLRQEEKLLEAAFRAQQSLRRLSLAASAGLNAAAQLGYCAALIWGAGMVARGGLSFGSLTAALQLLLQLRGPVVSLSGLLPRISAVAASAERLMELEELPQEEKPQAPRRAQFRALVFEHVDFRYPDDERPVLQDFSLRLEAGRWLCLTGPSGKGKSTVFKLALGLYRPQRGRVYVETDQGEVECGAESRHWFGFVPQNRALFYGTIRENLLLANPEAGDGQLWQALETAGAAFVRSLPAGLDTPLRENGGGLSEGQGQRLTLARALLTGAPLLLLDECTSALDRETERLVLQRLLASGRGALLVSHRADALPKDIPTINMEEQT